MSKIKTRKPPVWKRKTVEKREETKPYRFPITRSRMIDKSMDYSRTENLRPLLNQWHCNGLISYPPFLLELTSLFVRFVNTTVSSTVSHPVLYYQTPTNSVCNVIAALSWIYGHGYDRKLVDTYSEVQTLASLRMSNPKLFDISMELTQLLVACSWQKFGIVPSEVFQVRVGEWLDSSLLCLKESGVFVSGVLPSNTILTGGITPLPLYLVLLAIHPHCPDITEIPCHGLSFEQIASILLLEPKLYEGKCGELNLLPPENDGNDFNLWYFYDCLRPALT